MENVFHWFVHFHSVCNIGSLSFLGIRTGGKYILSTKHSEIMLL